MFRVPHRRQPASLSSASSPSWIRYGLILGFLVLCASAPADQVRLQWDANSEPDIAGYRVRRGVASGSYSQVIDVGPVTIADVTGLDAGTTYYFTVLAYNTSGLESAPSNEISYSVPGNQAPTASPITITVAEDGAAAAVLAGTDPDGNALTYSVTTQPAHGTLSGTPPNLTYRPAANYHGSDSFAYVAHDGALASAPASATVTVTPVNDAPVATAVALTVAEDGTVSFVLSGTDPDGDTLAYLLASGPSNGVLGGTPPNLTYQPSPNFHGGDSVIFQVRDGSVTSTAATVAITVTPVNDAPVAYPVAASGIQGQAIAIVLNGADVDGGPLYYSVTGQPTHGTLSGTPPNLTYQANSNYFGADSIAYTVGDGSLVSAVATVSIEITLGPVPAGMVRLQWDANSEPDLAGYKIRRGGSSGACEQVVDVGLRTVADVAAPPEGSMHYFSVVAYNSGGLESEPSNEVTYGQPGNTTPVATAATATVAEDGVVSIVLSGTDADGDALSYAPTSGPTHGTLSGTAPNLTYRPAANYHGSDAISFTVSDGSATSVAATVTITVTPVNDAPVATAATATVAEDGVVTIVLSGTDADGDALTYTPTGTTAHGVVSGTAPNLTYLPAANYHGPDAISFTVSDGSITSAAATVAITVTPVNDAPVATAATATVAEDGVVTIVLSGTDADGDALTYTPTGTTAHGVVSGTAPNLTYRPATNYHGPDAISFTVRDGSITSAAATVTITVTPVNDAPVATASTATVAEDGVVSIVLSGTDVDGDALTYTPTGTAAHGVVSGTAPNLTYRPATNYHGPDAISFTVSDGSITSAAATVAITVTPVNDAPVATAATATVAEDGVVSIVLTGTDVDGDVLTYTPTGTSAHGVVSGTAPNLTYRPAANYHGPDAIGFTVSDGSITSAAATVGITVTPVNDAPVATASTATVVEDGVVSIVLSGTDVDGDVLTYTPTSGPTHGVVSGTAPNLTYRPAANYHGPDAIGFTVSDGSATSAVATVAIMVTAANDAPVAVADTIIVLHGGDAVTLAGGEASVLANDTPGDGTVLGAILRRAPAHGSIDLHEDGTFEYQHDGSSMTQDSFDYAVQDGSGTSEDVTVVVQVFGIHGVRRMSQEDVGVEFPVVAGRQYRLEYNDTTPDPAATWEVLTAFVAEADADAEIRVQNTAHLASRFYRAVCVTASGDLVTEAWGHRLVPLTASKTELSAPFQGTIVRRTSVADVTATTVRLAGAGWAAGEIGPRDGFPSHVVIVKDGDARGEWWPVEGHDDVDITLGTSGESLVGRVAVGAVVEVVRLQSFADMFGSVSDPGRSFDQKDLFTVNADARTVAWTVSWDTNSLQVAGYFVTRGGVKSGPFDGTALTFLPGMSGTYQRSGGTATEWVASGRVQNSPVVHLLSTKTVFIGSAFPVATELGNLGLLDAGWRADSNFVARTSEDDVISGLLPTGKLGVFFYHQGSVRSPGWYATGGIASDSRVIPAASALRISLVRRDGWMRWVETAPWQ